MDKKLKKAADKITMPEDMKERIIRACESAEKNNITRIDNEEGYAEVVSGTERVAPRSRIIRTVSAAAACLVLLAGIGTTGVLLHRQNSNIAGSSAASDAEHSCPFGDFSTFDYSFDAGDGKYGSYSAETYAELSDFLNKFDWGESVEKEAGRDKEVDVYDPMYDIKWTRGDTPPIDCDLHIANDGYVSYQESMMDFETGGQMPLTENSKWYKIDFDVFDSGIKEIIAQENDITQFVTEREQEYNVKLGETCETENWEYFVKSVKLTKSGEGMDILPEGHYSCDENGDLTCDSTYIIADMEVTNKSYEDRSLYMNSTRIDLYNYNAEELDFKTSVEATAYTFNGDRSIYEGDFFKVDFKAGETRAFRVGYIFNDEYIKKSFDVIRIEINHSGMEGFNENIRYYILGEKTSLNDIDAAYRDEYVRLIDELQEKTQNSRNYMEAISAWLKDGRAEVSVSTFHGANRRLLGRKEKDKLLNYIESHDFGEHDTETVIPDVPDDYMEIADDGPFKFALNIECDNIIFSGMLAFTRDMKYAAFYYGGVLKYVEVIELPDAEQLEFLYNTD